MINEKNIIGRLSYILNENPRELPVDKDGYFSLGTVALILDIKKKELKDIAVKHFTFEIIDKRFSTKIRIREIQEDYYLNVFL